MTDEIKTVASKPGNRLNRPVNAEDFQLQNYRHNVQITWH